MATLYPFKSNRCIGLADATGRVHVAPVYDRIEPLADGRRLVERGFARGFLDAEGKVAIPLHFGNASSFAHGLAWASATIAGAQGLIDVNGEWVLPAKYGWPTAVSPEFAVARPSDKETWGLLEIATEKWVVEPVYKAMRGMGAGLVRFIQKRKMGAMTFDGKVFLKDAWESLHRNDDGTFLARAKKKAPWQRLDAKGALVDELEAFHDLYPYVSGFAPAKRGKLWGLVDKDGVWVLDPVGTMPPTPSPDGSGPYRILAKKYGYATPAKGVLVEPTYAHATVFEAGHAIADGKVLDAAGKVVATVDESTPPVVAPAAPPAKDVAAKALVAMCGRPSKQPADPALLRAIGALPSDDLAAVLDAWARAGQPWIQIGVWEIYRSTSGKDLVAALLAGKKRLPFGTGDYDDPIAVRFPRGELQIKIESNPDDTAPRTFHSLDSFVDAVVIDAIDKLEPGSDKPWPPSEEITKWLEAAKPSEYVQKALANHARLVVMWKGVSDEAREAAQAWLDAHESKRLDPATLPMTFKTCQPKPVTEPPEATVKLLTAGGHLRFQRAGDRWIALSNKGIRFEVKGKRKTAGLTSGPAQLGPAVAVQGDVALVGGRCEVLRVDLATGKKSTIFQRMYGDVHAVAPIADADRLVVAARGEEFACTHLEVLDIEGKVLSRITMPPGVKLVRGLLPLSDALVLLASSGAVHIVDVAAKKVVALFDRTAKSVAFDGKRLVLTDFGDKAFELTKR